MNIILPVAGKSSRFSLSRPKWLLTNPNGNLMVVDALVGLKIKKITKIFLIYLREHEKKFNFKKGLIENLKKYNLQNKIEFIELENETNSQVETVTKGLEKINKDISFLIKDCDNSFEIQNQKIKKNSVIFYDLNKIAKINPSNKSYLEIDSSNIILNIVEKKVISNKFCCGAYFFESSFQFIKYSKKISKNCYISDLIFSMILENKVFFALECLNYQDWGTIEDWREYKNQYKTIFLDIDGTIVFNSSAYLPPYIGQTEIIKENINYLNQICKTNKIEIILTTSRPEKFRKITEKQIKKSGLKYKKLIMDLQHSKRIVINDFNSTNEYKTCECINVPRNSNNLENYLKNI